MPYNPKKTLEVIDKQGNGYIVVLKNNQKHLREDLIKQVDKPALGEYVWQQCKHAV
jgi:hypothetical protein